MRGKEREIRLEVRNIIHQIHHIRDSISRLMDSAEMAEIHDDKEGLKALQNEIIDLQLMIENWKTTLVEEYDGNIYDKDFGPGGCEEDGDTDHLEG